MILPPGIFPLLYLLMQLHQSFSVTVYFKNSLVNAFTFWIPCRVSSTMVLDSATCDWAFFEYLRIARPKKNANRAIGGTTASIKTVSLKEVSIISVIPPVIIRIWEIRSASVSVIEC